MEKNKLPNFIIIWHEDKAALIDPEGKVCLGVRKYKSGRSPRKIVSYLAAASTDTSKGYPRT